MVIRIPLSKKGINAGLYEAIVDDCDKILGELNWTLKGDNKVQYAYRKSAADKTSNIFLHRIIMERMLEGRKLEKHELIDHINGNGLDNRRENLRLATSSQNQANKGKGRNNTTGRKGVFWNKNTKKWYSQITVNRKIIFIGLFNTLDEAYEAYCKKAKELFGEYARLE